MAFTIRCKCERGHIIRKRLQMYIEFETRRQSTLRSIAIEWSRQFDFAEKLTTPLAVWTSVTLARYTPSSTLLTNRIVGSSLAKSWVSPHLVLLYFNCMRWILWRSNAMAMGQKINNNLTMLNVVMLYNNKLMVLTFYATVYTEYRSLRADFQVSGWEEVRATKEDWNSITVTYSWEYFV